MNANGLRIGHTHTWPSTWFASGSKFKDLLIQDVQIKRYLRVKFKESGLSDIFIERGKKVIVTIHTSKPGVLIGKQGAAIDDLRKELEIQFGTSFMVEVQEVRNPDSNPDIIAETIQGQIQRRMPYRRAVKMAMEKALQSGAVGIKITVAGRLNGAEIARDELFKQGTIPLQMLRANIQHSKTFAMTKFGTIGIQVWVNKGMVFKKVQQAQSSTLNTQAA
ncbi:MAG: ribosomal protein [Candidatus Peribacteria bacterium]|nr:ribosomal protein [Candidatus Peribacteria bacterium]